MPRVEYSSCSSIHSYCISGKFLRDKLFLQVTVFRMTCFSLYIWIIWNDIPKNAFLEFFTSEKNANFEFTEISNSQGKWVSTCLANNICLDKLVSIFHTFSVCQNSHLMNELVIYRDSDFIHLTLFGPQKSLTNFAFENLFGQI